MQQVLLEQTDLYRYDDGMVQDVNEKTFTEVNAT